MRHRVFFPQQALDQWLALDRVELLGRELRLKPEGRSYRVVDAVRVLEEVSGGRDIYDIVGRVKSLNFLTELGAELLGTSMLIGDSAYDVVPGFLAAPVVGSLATEGAGGQTNAGAEVDDEVLLGRLVAALG